MCAQRYVSGVPCLRLPSRSRAHRYGAAALLACSSFNAGENGMMIMIVINDVGANDDES